MIATLTPSRAPAEGDLYDPTAPEPDFRFEVVDGRIVRKRMGAEEMRWAGRLSRRLNAFTESAGIGESFVDVGFRLPDGPDRRPDMSYVGFDRWPADRPFPHGDFVPLVPDLVAEVVSPHDTAREVTRKVEEYLDAGVRLVWVVYPDQALVHVFGPTPGMTRLTRGDTLTADPVVPGFALPLADLFPPPAPEAS